MKKVSFDIGVNEYDRYLMDTKIGRIQRNRITQYMDNILNGKKELSILELSCTVGGGAAFFDSFQNKR